MKFLVDRSVRSRGQKAPRVVAALVSVALLATALEAHQPAEAAPTADPKPAAAKVASRPDVISASVTARAQGSRVEVESMRTETSTTWSNPDGTMTTDAHATPIRFKTAKGAWQSINLTLQKAADGTVAPRGHQHGLRLGKRNAATGQVFASASSGTGRQVEWLSPWKLPEPTLDGTKATYADVQPGVDLVLDARRTGFENDFIVKQRPTTAPVWRIPLRTKGLTPRTVADGSIEFVDAKNVVRSKIPVGFMWDATTDGEQANKTVVKVTVEQVSRGKATLVIAPDAKWFLDPSRVFPVTVDPTYVTGTLKSTFDTWLQDGEVNDQSNAVDLRVGKNGTAKVARAYMNFATSTFAGKDILSASMSLWQYGANTCTPTVVQLRSATPTSATTRWPTRPVDSAVYGSVSAAKGATGCPGGRISIPMTGLAQAWSTASYPTGGLALTAANETDGTAYKRFYSFAGIADPYVTMTWNRKPGQPSVPAYSSAVAYAAPGGTSALYSPYLNPWAITKASDPDGNTVKYVIEFHDSTTVSSSSLKATCTSATYASGTTGGCKPSVNLPENTLIYVRAKSNDGRVDSAWSGWSQLRIGATQPQAPVISCPQPYAINSWQDDAPTADVVCTVTATGTGYSSPGYIRLTVDGKLVPTNFTGGAAGQIKITPSSDPATAKTTITLPKGTPGLHRISATAESPAGRLSGAAAYSFGWGGSALASPTANPRITTTGTIKIEASGPPRGAADLPTAKVRWRLSGYAKDGQHDTVGWNVDETPLIVTDNGAAGIRVTGQWNAAEAKVDANVDSDPDTAGIQPTTLNDRVPVLLDVQVCITYASSSQCSWSQTPNTTVQRVPHAFGDGFPTAEAGPGQVALWTGEFATEVTDVSVPAYGSDLAVSRSHSTYAGPPSTVNGVFGPGWSAQFSGAETGAAGLQVVDATQIDGTLAFVDGDGSALVFQSPTGLRRTSAAFAPGVWVAADEADAASSKLTVSGSGAATTLTLSDEDGSVTTWSAAGAPTAAAVTTFRPLSVAEPGIVNKTAFSYDAAGRIARILAPSPPGVTCPATGSLNAGCRALRFGYAASGDDGDRLAEVWLDAYNPDRAGGAGMDSIKVAAYAYDADGRLSKASDPRSGLATDYGYNAANHLTSVKPAGLVPFQFDYATVNGQEQLTTVRRDRPAGDPSGGTAVLGRFVYDVPLSGDGLPDLSASSVARWSQSAPPARGFAVFGPDHPTSAAPGADDWQYAALQYADANGYTTNAAQYGAGAWQYTATDYNDQGNITRELSQRALRAIIDDSIPAGASADQLATSTVYNKPIGNAAGDAVVVPAGTYVTDTYGPARSATLRDGTLRWVRPHEKSWFDQNAPNGDINPETGLPYQLVTQRRTSAFDPGSGTELDVTASVLTQYQALTDGDVDGWALGRVSKSISDLDLSGDESAGDIVSVSRYDAEGRVIEARQPRSDGADAATLKTVYYTAAANSVAPECGAKPVWAGRACKTSPAAAPTTSAGTSPTLPTTTSSALNYLLDPTVVRETSGAAERVTTTTYLPDGRMKTSKTVTTGITGTAPSAEKSATYDSATGALVTLTAQGVDGTTSTVTTGMDGWGRQVSYQSSGDPVTTTVYNAAGAPAKVTDSNGSTTFSYDGTDADGRIERRGLPVKVDVTTAGATWSSTGAYDSNAALTTRKLPGDITQSIDYDDAGNQVGSRYSGQVTSSDESGNPIVDPDGDWLAWSVENDVMGRKVRELTPDGAGFQGPPATAGQPDVGDARPYDRQFAYDLAGRLVQVKDRTAAVTGADLTDPAQAPACVTRGYGYDENSNRLTKTLSGPAADGGCSTANPAVQSRTFDTADRPVSGNAGAGGYSYDQLGRMTTIPAADAPRPDDGSIQMGYYDTDQIRSIEQAGVTTTFTLDAMDRRAGESVSSTSGTTQTVRHYTDGSDKPTWVSQGTVVQRYAAMIGGDLSLTVDQTGAADLVLNDLQGSAVTTVTLPAAGQAAIGIDGWSAFDEFGLSVQTGVNTGVLDYGWLGGSARAVSGAGLVLLGARVYNPVTGLFTSLDPVRGGNANQYMYPADPVNSSDVSGLMERPERGGGGSNACKCTWKTKRWKRFTTWYDSYTGWIPSLYSRLPAILKSFIKEVISIVLSRGTYTIEDVHYQRRTKHWGDRRCRNNQWQYRYNSDRQERARWKLSVRFLPDFNLKTRWASSDVYNG